MITDNTVKFSGQTYYTDIILQNVSQSVEVPPAMVRDLIIKDNIYSIFPTAVLTLNTTGNAIENLVLEGKGTYDFNVDGEDRIVINIGPIGPDGTTDNFPPDIYAFQGIFKIYDEEEIIAQDGIEKGKILHLRDIREDILDNSITMWSTALPVNERYKDKLQLSQVSNTLREVKTGTGIRHRINSVLQDQIFKEWDSGQTGTFYTSPVNASALDDIEYMLDRHVSTDNFDNCILKVERDNKWVLRPYSSYFRRGMENSREFVIDIFSITGTTPQQQTPTNDPLGENLDRGNSSQIVWDELPLAITIMHLQSNFLLTVRVHIYLKYEKNIKVCI